MLNRKNVPAALRIAEKTLDIQASFLTTYEAYLKVTLDQAARKIKLLEDAVQADPAL
jgi:hypothetical protein